MEVHTVAVLSFTGDHNFVLLQYQKTDYYAAHECNVKNWGAQNFLKNQGSTNQEMGT